MGDYKNYYNLSKSFFIGGVVAIAAFHGCSSPPDESERELLNKYYSRAELFFEKEEIDSSLHYLEKCLEIDREYSKALYLRGRVYLYKDGIYNRRISASLLRKAVMMDKENSEYHYSLGVTLEKQGFLKNALDEYERAAKYDSTDSRPYLKIAEISKKIGLRYDDKDYFEQSAMAAAKAANISNDPESYYKQAAALYQMDRYAISARTLEQAVSMSDDTSMIVDCELLLGTNLVRTGNFDSAYAAFESARGKMSEITRAKMDNPRFLMTPADYEALIGESSYMQKRILTQFWGELDPDPTTGINERKLEHYARYIHSRLTFSVPGKSIDGCQTKRGEMYIRYGPPSSKDYVLGGSGTGRDVPKWVWTYNHFEEPITLVFDDTFLNGDFDFPFPSSNWTAADYANNPAYLAERMRSSYPQVFGSKMGAGPLYFTYLPRQFKGPRGKTDLEIFLAIPFTQMEFERRGETAYSDINWRQILRFPSWRGADSAIVERTYEIRASQIDNPNVDMSDRLKLSAYPDTLVLAISLRDLRSNHVGIGKTGIRLRDFYTDKVELSDMVLARRIDKPARKLNFKREDLRILSNLDNRYFTAEPVWLYFEFYNLKPGPDGKTSYTINQKITERRSDGLLAAIKHTIAGGDVFEIITSYEGSSIHTYENRILTLDLSELEAGDYLITIEIIDRISGDSASVSEKIELYR
ncbi:MAG: GWxTD domain-containing protein [Candidatus Zixiibacteriota bacterium]|nr:MAG: GWxTD domain-containing protein [candidate division Zixibacteria bacterium]